ncbi:MAG: hypothetical protein IT280_09950 [Ignavibacteria bacterium]|nr:hypothetical protein [Ignavibacteria bacterium]
MKILIIMALATIIFTAAVYSQDTYKITYKYSEKEHPNTKNFILEKNGNNYKFIGVDTYGNDVIMYINKDERKIYTVTKNGDLTIGTRYNGIDCSYPGMHWGVYLLDLDKCGYLMQSVTASGSDTIAGKECTIYNAAQQGNLRTDYYIYNNQISLKMSSPSTTIEAISFDESPVFSSTEFTPPSIDWIDQN